MSQVAPILPNICSKHTSTHLGPKHLDYISAECLTQTHMQNAHVLRSPSLLITKENCAPYENESCYHRDDAIENHATNESCNEHLRRNPATTGDWCGASTNTLQPSHKSPHNHAEDHAYLATPYTRPTYKPPPPSTDTR